MTRFVAWVPLVSAARSRSPHSAGRWGAEPPGRNSNVLAAGEQREKTSERDWKLNGQESAPVEDAKCLALCRHQDWRFGIGTKAFT